MNDTSDNDPRLYAIPDIHGHAKGEHKAFIDERPIPLSARMLFLWFYHACRRGWPRFMMVTDHMNYLTFEDPAAINLVRRALKLAQAGDLYGAAETASVEVGHAAVVSEGLRRGMRYSIGAEVDNDPRSRPDAQNIVDAMKPDGMIRSVHFLTIDHPTHGPNWNWPFDNSEFADVFDFVGTAKTWELYMTTLLDAVERLPGNIVGHFYVPALFGHWPDDAVLETYEDQLVAACEARGMAIEFNTRFLYRPHSDEERAKYLAAHRRLLAKCKEKNVGIAVGSDAHSPKDQGAGFATVLALLDDCEINELVFPIAGRLARVALRVERKVEPAVEPVRVEERKPPVRKAVRPSSAQDVGETADDAEPAAPLKAKARPKRSRPKVSAADGDEATSAVGEPANDASTTVTAASVPAEPTNATDAAAETNAPAPPESPADKLTPVTEHMPAPAAGEDQPRPAGNAEVTLGAGEGETAPVAGDSEAARSAKPGHAVDESPLGASDVSEPTTIKPVSEEAFISQPVASESEETRPPEAAAKRPSKRAGAAKHNAAKPPAVEPVAIDTAEETIAAPLSGQIVSEAVLEPLIAETPVGVTVEAEAGVEGDVPLEPPVAAPGPVAEREPVHAAPARPRKSRPLPAPVKAKAGAHNGKAPASAANAASKKAAKPATKAAPAKKTAAKKAAVKKTPLKKAAPAKKAGEKKTPVKKAAVRSAGAKKSTAKKSAAKKTAPKKPAQRRR